MRSYFLELKVFLTKLYDKRRDFTFNIVSFANFSYNIPNFQAYGYFTGELYKICKSSTRLTDFKAKFKF